MAKSFGLTPTSRYSPSRIRLMGKAHERKPSNPIHHIGHGGSTARLRRKRAHRRAYMGR